MTSNLYTRRNIIGAAISLLTVPDVVRGALAAQALPQVQAYRNPGCSCCEIWAEHMRRAGFSITMVDDSGLAARRAGLGVPEEIFGCHTALVGDYVVEGHVPPEDVMRLLAEKPDARGLAVPGMPVGSPGMDGGSTAEPYDVLIFTAGASWKVYASH